MKGVEYKITSHVKREGNKPADYLANWGCKEPSEGIDASWHEQAELAQWDDLKQLIDRDNHDAEHS